MSREVLTQALLNALANMDDAVVAVNPSQDIIYYNHGAEKLFAYSPEEILGRPINMLVPDVSKIVHKRHIQGFFDGSVSSRRVVGSVIGRRKDGSEFSAEESLVRTGTGDEAVAMAVIRDTSSRTAIDKAFRAMAEKSSELISIISADRRFNYVNPALRRVLGYNQSELLHEFEISKLVHPDDLDSLRMLAPGESLEYRARTKQGDWVWLEGERYGLIIDGDEQFVSVDREITERKKAEVHRAGDSPVESQAEQLRRLFDGANEPIYALDTEWRYTFLNQTAFEHIRLRIGSLPQEILGHTIWELFPEIESTKLAKVYRRVMASRTPGTFDDYYPPRDRWYRVLVYPTSNGIACLSMDVTDIRTVADLGSSPSQAAQALPEGLSADSLSAFSLIPEPVIVFDSNFRAIYLNSAALTAGGHGRQEDVLGKTPWELAPAIRGAELERRYREAMEQQKRHEQEFFYKAVGQWYRLSFLPYPSHIIVVAVDITDQKRFEKTAELLTETLDQALDASWDRKPQRDTSNTAHRSTPTRNKKHHGPAS